MHRTDKIYFVQHLDVEETSPNQTHETALLFPVLSKTLQETNLSIEYRAGMIEIRRYSSMFEENESLIRRMLEDMITQTHEALQFISNKDAVKESSIGLARRGITEEVVGDLDRKEVKLMLSPSEIRKLKNMGIMK